MKKNLAVYFLFPLYVLLLVLACDTGIQDNRESNSDTQETGDPDILKGKFKFTDGIHHNQYSKIYALWMENDEENFFRNVFICNRINLQNLTGTALPFWQINKRNLASQSDIDGVSGATVKDGDFTIELPLHGAPAEVTVYFEIDHSFDSNDWFNDQPAILYRADIDLTIEGQQTLQLIGWTPNENTNSYEDDENSIPGMNVAMGTLQRETRYITHHKDEHGNFSNLDEEPASDLVGNALVTIY